MVCRKCVMPDNYPGIKFDENGVCNFCNKSSDEIQKKDVNVLCEEELIYHLEKYRGKGNKYDVLVPVSGGVDSTNALVTITEKYKLRALAYHNDHGYEDPTATKNVRKICKDLNVDLMILQQDLQFMKKLWKYIAEARESDISGCYICGNILYLNSIELADQLKIPLLINGYSKGQASMTDDKQRGLRTLEKILTIVRRTEDQEFIDEIIRKYSVLKRKRDFTNKKDFSNEDNKILIIPFYIFNFYKSDKDVLKDILTKRFGWEQIEYSYPKRTTNCRMAWLNTYMDFKKMNYSMYHIEYSEQIRRGEISREQAMKDLIFCPPDELIEKLLNEINLNPSALC